MAVHDIASVVDIERNRGRRSRVGRHPLIDERVGQAHHVSQRRRVLQPRQSRLRAQVPASVGQPPAGELERRIGAQVIEIIGVLVTAADREHSGADHVGDRVRHGRAIAPIWEATRQTLGQGQAPLGQRKQHHAAVRGHPAAIECGCDFLPLKGRKREQRNRIVGHGSRGGREGAQRICLSNRIYAIPAA